MRLVLPVWIFLTIFFIGTISVKFVGMEYPFTFDEILRTYALIDGIGYVWIIRVYLLCALSVPLLVKLKERLNCRIYYILIIILYVVYEILYYLFGTSNPILNYVIYYFIPYGVLTFIGMEMREWKSKSIIQISEVMMIIFLILMFVIRAINGKFLMTNQFKYPPRLYYLGYAISVSLMLYFLVEIKDIFNIKENVNITIISFISKHTMWIYLWHVLYIYIINFKFNTLNWIIKFIAVLTLAISTTLIQSKIIRKLKIKNKLIISIMDC